MREIDVKISLITKLNHLSNGVTSINKGLNKLYSKNFPNIAEVYREKMLQLELMLKEKGMSFYTNNILGDIVLFQLDELLDENYLVLKKIATVFEKLPSNRFLSKIFIRSYSKLISDYEESCSLLINFSINDIVIYTYNFFKTRQSYDYRPNWFYENYDNLKDILTKLGIDFGNMDDILMPVIEKQESGIRTLYECAILETGSLDETVIKKYINDLVLQVQGQINEQQKIRD